MLVVEVVFEGVLKITPDDDWLCEPEFACAPDVELAWPIAVCAYDACAKANVKATDAAKSVLIIFRTPSQLEVGFVSPDIRLRN